MLQGEILNLAESVQAEAIAWRRHLHRHPELSFAERETAAFVAERLKEMGYEPISGLGGGHSVVARLSGGRPGPTIALRADMDALPIAEETGLPFASINPGVMHACGHDAHTAILLGAAKTLMAVSDQVPGDVVFLFQPAEEVAPGGAKAMVEAGVLDGVHSVYGLHVGNMLPAGRIGFRAGPVYAASDAFRVRLLGKGGHAATPHLTIDPIAMLGQAITAVQNIASRMVSPLESAVVTIAWVHGGGPANNVIPEAVEFGGTIRTFDEGVREAVHQRLCQVVEGVVASFGGRAEVEVRRGYPVLHNDEAMTQSASMAAAAVLGAENVVLAARSAGGEDFAYYALERPACFARLGTGTPETVNLPVHNSRFVLDERALVVGISYYLALVFLGQRS